MEAVRDDGSFVLPALKNLERRAKELIQNIDHMGGIVIDSYMKLFPDRDSSEKST
jgi:hypothetical protein